MPEPMPSAFSARRNRDGWAEGNARLVKGCGSKVHSMGPNSASDSFIEYALARVARAWCRKRGGKILRARTENAIVISADNCTHLR